MSSLRNAIPRRPHKERSQEHARAKHGLLEKHKDYAARARDFNVKKARLRILRQKATDRNPDEFHFGMMSSTTKNGIKVADRGNRSLSDEVVKLLKTQDAGYLRTMAVRARKERERLEEAILVDDKEGGLKALKDVDGQVKSSHTVFVDDEEAQKDFDAEAWFGTDAEGVDRAYNRPRRIDTLADQENLAVVPPEKKKTPREIKAAHEAWKLKKALEKKRTREQERRLGQLDAARTREKELMTAEQELDTQRAKMNHNIGGVNKNGVKFKPRERKR